MLVKDLLQNLDYHILQGTTNKRITSVAYHSKKVTTNGAFVAIKGFSTDGHQYVKQAISNGASVIFIEDDLNIENESKLTIIQVSNTRKLLAHIANNFFNRPSEKLKVTGITGTNGKTTTSHFLHEIYLEHGENVATIGTTGIIKNRDRLDKSFSTVTTPEALDLHQLFNDLSKKNFNRVILEVSSHSLSLHRVDGTKFHSGMFSNLSPDHIELHKTMENYFLAKARLFQLTEKHNIINVDDPYGKKLVDLCKHTKAKTTTIGIHYPADIRATNIQYSLEGTSYTLITPTYEMDITLSLPGKFNVYNSLLAIAEAYLEDIPKSIIQKAIANVKHIPGRFNTVYEKDDFKVIIDFAHTEDALENILKTVKPFTKGRIILVFGVYADMSEYGRAKRLNMGEVAGRLADFSVVTLDNPKYNDPNVITKEIIEGIESESGKYKAILDRRLAIEYALEISEPKDTVIIAGKGHETTQIINGEETYFNEEEIVLNTLKEVSI